MEQEIQKKQDVEERLADYRDLYQKGLFLDVVKDAQQHFGDYRQYTNIQLRLLIARCLTHLGLSRDSDALVLRTWRQNPRDVEVADAYLDVIRGRRGPLIAWSESHDLLLNENHRDKTRSHMMCTQVAILATFRDFSFAEKLLQQARDIYVDRWVDLQRAYLFAAEDKYEDALKVCDDVVKEHPDYRPALQMLAHLHQLNGDVSNAIDILKPLLTDMQSYSIAMQLFNLYVESQKYPEAEDCLVVIESNSFAIPEYLSREIARAKSDLLCAQQRYEEALPHLEQKNFFQNTVSKTIKRTGAEGQRKVLDVPFVRQHHMTCAPASLSAISTYWGRTVSQSEVVEAICYDGTPAADERRWVQQQGWHVVEFELQFETAKALIDKGIPLLLSTVEPGSAHLQILVGYDQLMGTYLLRDPYYPRLQEMLIDASHEYYASSGPRCMVMMPVNQVDLLRDIHFEASELYDVYFKLKTALDKHNRAAAFTALRALIKKDAGHRLTLSACRDMALYDQDERGLLKYTEKLLRLFPDDINLQLSKVSSLSSISSAAASLEYLESLNINDRGHFLVRSRLAEELRIDHRQQPRVEKLLKSLLAVNPTHPGTLYAWAGLLWDKGQFSRSYEINRFITCLEDKVESYAMSYFKAARYHKETEVAFEFLLDRYQRFTNSSCGPVISLFNALDLVSKTDEGLKYLLDAIKLRPDDGYLKLFTARQFLYSGEIKKCIRLANEAKALTSVKDYFELAAMIKEREQNRAQAIECWNKVLAYEPLNSAASNTKIRLLLDEGEDRQALQFIDSQLEKFPANYNLLCAKVRCIDEGNRLERIKAYRELIKNHPDDNWAYLGIVTDLLEEAELDAALFNAEEAIRVNTNDPAGYVQLARVSVAQQDMGGARTHYRKAIELSCDHVAAFEPLLQCALDYDSERTELAFIHEQLMSQVTFGDGILQYQYLAGRWLNAEEISVFLHQVVEERPDLWQSWLALANGYRDQGLLDKANNTLDSAIKRFPLIPDLYYEKAEILRLMNRLQDARGQLDEALSIAPTWIKAANKLSEILEMQGKFEEAIAGLRKVINQSPLEAGPHGYLASLLWRIGEKDLAVKEMIRALKLSPLYEWAWTELSAWCGELKQTGLVEDLIATLGKRMANDWRFLRIRVKLSADPNHCRELLGNYLDSHPHNIDLCREYIQVLNDLGDYATALSLCEDGYWNDAVPVEIQALGSWLLKQQGDEDKAIKAMQAVVRLNPNYYDGWRLLAHWFAEKEDSVSVIYCVDNCKRIYPNSPSVLCFVAEKLMEHDKKDIDSVTPLLKRAFYLDPADQYNGLTYIDHLIAKELYSDADGALETLKIHVNNAFIYSRELNLAYLRENQQKVMKKWQLICQCDQANNYVIDTGWGFISKMGCESQAVDTVERLREEGALAVSCVGENVASYHIKQQGLKAFEKRLLQERVKDDFYHRLMEGYLHTLIENEDTLPTKNSSKLTALIRLDTKNWGLLGYLYSNIGRWYSVTELMKDYKTREDLQAWMMYFYSIALRQTGQWDDAVNVMDSAYGAEPDNYNDDIAIWYFFDCFINDKDVDESRLQRIKPEDISGLSRYLLSIVNAGLSLRGGSFDEAYADISPCLRYCQREYQPLVGTAAATTAKNMLREKLKKSINQPFFKRVFWHWRLSNHF